MSKTKFKDNCSRCAKAWNCYSRDNCEFEEMPLDNAFDGFDDDKEKSFENIDIDGSPVNSWSKEDDEENNSYLAYCSSL